MPGLRRALLALFVVGVGFAAFDVALVLTSDHDPQKVLDAILGPVIGLSFIGTGVFAWWRRPLNRFGLLMCAVGFAWYLAALSVANDDTLHTAGEYVSPLYIVLVIQLLLAFPTGRLETPGARAIIFVGYLDAFLVTLPFFLLDGDIPGDGRTGNAFAVVHAPAVAEAFDVLSSLIAGGIAVVTVVYLMRRRRAATPPQRRAQAPMLWTGLAVISGLGLAFLSQALGLPDIVVGVGGLLAFSGFVTLPFAFLAG